MAEFSGGVTVSAHQPRAALRVLPCAWCPARGDVPVRRRSGSSETQISSVRELPAVAVADLATLGQNGWSAGTI